MRPQFLRQLPGFWKAIQADVGVQLTTIGRFDVGLRASPFQTLLQPLLILPQVDVDDAQLVREFPALGIVADTRLQGVNLFVHLASGPVIGGYDLRPLVIGNPVD